ncbi:hypothetical protein AAFP30_24615 [Gordonia sp. CPCC 205515]|uniref:hypothetical protein n=1 Tax=Gordonia sp. CPCC 205515 TaxID=3140791 RepID=UPI003AF3FEC2
MQEELQRFQALKHACAEIDDFVQDFLVDRIRPLTAKLVAEATSEDSVGRLLRKSIRNWLIDRARATGTGPLRRAVEKVLSDEDAFEKAGGGSGAGWWRLTGSQAAPWGGDPCVLLEAAWKVPDVRVPKWSSTSRRPPVADRPSLVAILEAVFRAAGGSIEVAELVHVLAQRFAAALDPIVTVAGEHDDLASTPASEPTPDDLVVADESDADTARAAAEIVGRLSDIERAIVPLLDDGGAVRNRLGLGKSQSAQFASRLKAKIVQLAGTGPESEHVVREVIWLCGGPATT